jgi:hypothetical protein
LVQKHDARRDSGNEISKLPRTKRKRKKASGEANVDLFLTDREAEIMFLVQKNQDSTTDDLILHYERYFGERKERPTISGIIKSITNKERFYNRNYLRKSIARPFKYSIPTENFVDTRKTAILLLEISRGYQKFGTPNPSDLYLKDFKRYISKVYGDLIPDLDQCLTKSKEAELVDFVDFDLGSRSVQGIRPNPLNHINHDLRYYVLLVEDYLRDLQQSVKDDLRETRKSPKQVKTMKRIGEHVAKLLDLFTPTAKLVNQ